MVFQPQLSFACRPLTSECSGRLSSGSVSDEESEYAASRYVPPLKGILSDLAANQLSFDDYPSVLPMPESNPAASITPSSRGGSSARSARQKTGGTARKSTGASSRWSKSTSSADSKRSSGPTNLSGGRLLTFMMGGISYPELRVAREVMAKESREIIIGSTAYLTANDFISDLSLLGQDDY